MTDPPTFDLCGDLPQGTTVLEASAGTGKTYTIAGLATRYLAEGVTRIEELMLVTFGRAATVELRERVRERLVEASTALADPEAARVCADDLLRHLADGTGAEVDVRRARLSTAVANFDAATIATTHGFCHQMLAGLGIAADVDHDATFAEAAGDLVTEVATDLYIAGYGRDSSREPTISFATATKVANQAVGDRQAFLEPGDVMPDSEPDTRRRFAERARTMVAERKRAMRVMDYDDLLVHLRDALTDPATGEDACARIRSRYKIVLVDEFQDTDPVQWQILERAFHGHRTLILIGDPKQAIYAFRGADVATYLLATEVSTSKATLGTNWRSDGPLVAALKHLIGDVALGDPRILVHDVDAAQQGRTLVGAPVDAPVRLKVVPRGELSQDMRKPLSVGAVRPFVAADVAADIVRVLTSGAELATDDVRRPVQPADIAVLVQRNDDGRTVRDALAAVDVPVVLHATTSVFGSSAARDWLTLLSALEQPHRTGLARGAALTDFVGWSTEQLATADDEALDRLGTQLREWAEVLTSRGVAALLERIVSTCGLTKRVLAREDGERDLTDLRHVGQSLHEAAIGGHPGVASLVEWLQHRIAEAKSDVTDERNRRLESDAKAVQILTVHRSKGLEYPIVYAPFLWDRYVPREPEPLRLHDASGHRVLDVGGTDAPGYSARKARHQEEDAGESLRLAYVALTRARSQVVTYWAPSSNTAAAPLHRLLFGTRTSDGQVPLTVTVPADQQARERLTQIVDGAGGYISLEPVRGADPVKLASTPTAYPDLVVRSFDRALDLAWARTSYSGLTAGLHELALAAAQATSEPEAPGTVDEPDLVAENSAAGPAAEAADAAAADPAAADIAAAAADIARQVSPMADLPGGASFGTLVHSILEEVDFTSQSLRDDLVEACAAAGSQNFVGVPATDLADGLLPTLLTPLGPRAGGRTLVDFGPRDRLDELSFELPLCGGDTPTGEATVAQIADLLRRHLSPTDPLVGYADDLAVPLLASRRMRGFLTGSIDAVLRVRSDNGTPRYLVVDYKTNMLGGTDETLSARHYRPEALTHAMREAHYPLQSLLYSVALHRFLRWRQPGYDPGVHLGGVLYLFLRGMCGPDTPVVDGTPCGVFSWAPPAALVEALSDLLDGRRS